MPKRHSIKNHDIHVSTQKNVFETVSQVVKCVQIHSYTCSNVKM